MKRRNKWILLGLAGAALGGGFAYSRTVWDYPWAAMELDAAVKEYRSLGLPWEAQEANPPVTTPGDNAAPMLEAVAQQLAKSRQRELPFQATLAEKAAFVRANAPIYARIEEAMKRSHYRPDRDWDRGTRMEFVDLAGAKEVQKLLSYRARLRAAEGDAAGAVDDLERMRRLALWVNEEPTFMSGLVAIALDAIATRTVEVLVESLAKNPPALSRLRQVMEPSFPMESLYRAIRAEAYFGVATLRNAELLGGLDSILDPSLDELKNPPPDPDWSKLRRSGLPDGLRARAHLTRYLQVASEISRTIKPTQSPVEVAKTVGRVAEQYAEERRQSYGFVQASFSVSGEVGKAYTRAEAGRAATEALAQVVAFRRVTGRWPKTLAEADAEFPDPFDGQPLRYKVTGDEVRIYSIGDNGKDDNGITQAESARTGAMGRRAFDEVAIYPSSRRNPPRPPIPCGPGSPRSPSPSGPGFGPGPGPQ